VVERPRNNNKYTNKIPRDKNKIIKIQRKTETIEKIKYKLKHKGEQRGRKREAKEGKSKMSIKLNEI
jgi:hypothetical protein